MTRTSAKGMSSKDELRRRWLKRPGIALQCPGPRPPQPCCQKEAAWNRLDCARFLTRFIVGGTSGVLRDAKMIQRLISARARRDGQADPPAKERNTKKHNTDHKNPGFHRSRLRFMI